MTARPRHMQRNVAPERAARSRRDARQPTQQSVYHAVVKFLPAGTMFVFHRAARMTHYSGEEEAGMRTARWLGSVLLVSALIAGCSEARDLTGPTQAAPRAVPEATTANGLLSDVTRLVQATVELLLPAVERVTPLADDAHASAVIGPDGGELRAGDVTLRIPAGALKKRTRIDMLVPAGNYSQVQFSPHGLEFRKPAELIFQVPSAAEGEYVGTYFEDSIVNGLIPALEVLPASSADGEVRFWIEHFSRYAPAYRGYTAAGG